MYVALLWWGLHTDFISAEVGPSPPKKEDGYPGYEPKLHTVVRHQLWSSGKCGVYPFIAITPRFTLTQSGRAS